MALQFLMTSSISDILDYAQSNEDGGVTVTIDKSEADFSTTPLPVWFETRTTGFTGNRTATFNAYLDAYHNHYVFWGFGEGYTVTAPSQVVALDADDGGERTNSRYMRGPNAAHVYRATGTHTIRCAVYEPSSDKWGYATTSITVTDPDDDFADSDTHFVDTTGNYANAPAGVTSRHTTFDSAFLAANNKTKRQRIIFEGGQTFSTATTENNIRMDNGSATTGGFHMQTRDGAGSKAIIQTTDDTSADSVTMFIGEESRRFDGDLPSATAFKDLIIEGDVDVTGVTGTTLQTVGVEITRDSARSIVFDGCELRKLRSGVIHQEAGAQASWPLGLEMSVDSVFGPWRDFSYGGGNRARQAFIGTSHVQDVDAISEGSKDTPFYTVHSTRIHSPRQLIFYGCDFFSCNGWSPSGAYSGNTAVQPALRLNTSPIEQGVQIYVADSVLESARQALQIVATPQEPLASNTLIEGNVMISGHQATEIIGTSCGGTTIRSNMMIRSANDEISASMLALANGGIQENATATETQNNLEWPVRAYNNTLVNLGGTAMSLLNNALSHTDVDVNDNNIIHEPNLGSPNTPDAPVTLAETLTARYKGYRQLNGTLIADTDNSGAGVVLSPDAGSAAIDGATTGNISRTRLVPDFSASAIIALRDRGAVQT